MEKCNCPCRCNKGLYRMIAYDGRMDARAYVKRHYDFYNVKCCDKCTITLEPEPDLNEIPPNIKMDEYVSKSSLSWWTKKV